MNVQDLLVTVLVVGAVAALARRVYALGRGAGTACATCAGCTLADDGRTPDVVCLELPPVSAAPARSGEPTS